jgi:hypothetical protein
MALSSRSPFSDLLASTPFLDLATGLATSHAYGAACVAGAGYVARSACHCFASSGLPVTV